MASLQDHLLIPLMAAMLVGAQSLWATAIKQGGLLEGSYGDVLVKLASSSFIWLGLVLYVATTGLYFYVVSKIDFFVIQVSMTSLAVLFSTAVAALVFGEAILVHNVVGAAMVIGGLVLVFWR